MKSRLVNDVAGLILSGGRGSRLGGRDKGLVLAQGRPLIAHVIERFAPQVVELYISANRNTEEYSAYGYPVVRDFESDFQGPLSGIHRALTLIQQPYLAVVPCDSPHLPLYFVRQLHDALLEAGSDICTVHDGVRLHPVFALFRITLRDSLSEFLDSGNRKISLWFQQHNCKKIDFSSEISDFLNINSPKDLELLEQEGQEE